MGDAVINRIAIGPLVFDDMGLEEAANAVIALAKGSVSGLVVTPNGCICSQAFRDAAFASLLCSAALTLPDGVGVTAAARLLQTPFRNGKVAGVELGIAVAQKASREGLPLFLLGGRAGVAQKSALNLKKAFPSLTVAGVLSGYGIEADATAAAIKASGARLVYCCLGSPLQEEFAARLLNSLSLPILCLGGSLDVYAGEVKRAPRILCQMGLEWAYRILSDPKRLPRLIPLSIFLVEILTEAKKRLAFPLPKGYNKRIR